MGGFVIRYRDSVRPALPRATPLNEMEKNGHNAFEQHAESAGSRDIEFGRNSMQTVGVPALLQMPGTLPMELPTNTMSSVGDDTDLTSVATCISRNEHQVMHEPVDNANEHKGWPPILQTVTLNAAQSLGIEHSSNNHAFDSASGTSDQSQRQPLIQRDLNHNGSNDRWRCFYTDRLFHISGPMLCEGVSRGYFSPEPPVSEREILDRSKRDSLVKCITMVQLAYFFLGIADRLYEKLPISHFELIVAAFAVSSTVTFGFWLNKPQNVETTVCIAQFEEEMPSEIYEMAKELFRPEKGDSILGERQSETDIPTGYEKMYMFLASLSSALLGSIHVAGWNFSFPTQKDVWIWRCASLVTTAVPLLLPLWMSNVLLTPLNNRRIDKGWRGVLQVLCGLVAMPFLFYAPARVVLFVEGIRGLVYLPKDAYLATAWAVNIPHLG
ncbi:hypothetical protein LTR37_018466 [Vermiconidia calcicola]|uniref:Uncharacterized protein n=1 Tax=Vermiconidia calcicola TaxID=1690605 RepID=A0ACC3MH06_9PEZI|nr:hypothetical protein LTR37_018466 [Vermiconidia calcicola]